MPDHDIHDIRELTWTGTMQVLTPPGKDGSGDSGRDEAKGSGKRTRPRR